MKDGLTGGPGEGEIGSVRVVILEDEHLLLELLQSALNQKLGLQVVGAYADGSSFLASAANLQPDVALIDIELGQDLNGVRVGLQLRHQLPSVGIVLLSNHSDLRYLSAIPPKDVCGWSYLLKRSVQSLSTLQRAIAGAAAGLVVLDPLLVHQPGTTSAGSRISQLPARLRCLCQLIAQGYTNSAIARKLHLSPKTVENQINLLYQELGIDRTDRSLQPRVQAVLTYFHDIGHAGGDAEPGQPGHTESSEDLPQGPWVWGRSPPA